MCATSAHRHCDVRWSHPRRTYVIPRVLPQPSELIMASLPRPLGLVLEYDERRKRATVVELIEGSVAEQKSKV